MKNKFLLSTLVLLLAIIVLSAHTYATNNMMNSAGNAMKNVGNGIKDAAITTKDTIVNGTQDLTNGAATLGNDMMNGVQDDTDTAVSTLNTDYNAQRTATTDTGLFGMSDTLSTWVILGIVGAVIVGLVWYYGKQYEHKNYNND